MKSKEYKILFSGFTWLKFYFRDEQAVYADVNERIDNLVNNSNNPEKTIEALICKLSGTTNISDGSSDITLAYSLIIGVFTLISILVNGKEDDWYFHPLLNITIVVTIFCFILAIMGFISNLQGRKYEFVLNALKFRYEELVKDKKIEEDEPDKDKKEDKKKSKKKKHKKNKHKKNK